MSERGDRTTYPRRDVILSLPIIHQQGDATFIIAVPLSIWNQAGRHLLAQQSQARVRY